MLLLHVVVLYRRSGERVSAEKKLNQLYCEIREVLMLGNKKMIYDAAV